MLEHAHDMYRFEKLLLLDTSFWSATALIDTQPYASSSPSDLEIYELQEGDSKSGVSRKRPGLLDPALEYPKMGKLVLHM